MSLGIPDFAVEPLAFLLSLREEQLSRIISGFERIQPIVPFSEFNHRFAHHSGIDFSQSAQILQLLASLFASRGDLDVGRFVDGVCSAVEESPEKQLRSRIKNLPQLRSFLTEAFAREDVLRLVTKAHYLLTSRERFWRTAEIFTDVRYMFHDNPLESPVGSLILHTMHVTYLENGRSKNAFFALGPEDLDEIVELVERAKKKQNNLCKAITAMNIQCLNLEQSEL